MKRHTSYLFLACTFVAASAPAATIQVSPNPPVSAPVIVDATTGADMAGLIVTPTYLFPDGPLSLSFTWTRIDATSGAAMDPNGVFRAWVDGDTSGSLAWHYESMFLSPLLSLEFDGTAAGIYFDRSSPNPGTPGSGPGGDIIFGEVFPPGIDSGFVVTYSSMVSVGGNSAQGDLYAKLRFDFGGLPNGWLDPGGITNFTQDTDHVSPEPASALLVLCGLALYAVVRSRLPRGHITQLGSFAQHARLP